MFHLGHLGFLPSVLTLLRVLSLPNVSNAEESCQKADPHQAPIVTVRDRSSLLVDWTSVFVGCQENQVKHIKVQNSRKGTDLKMELIKTLAFGPTKTVIEKSPCLQLTVYVDLEFKNETKINSLPGTYNTEHKDTTTLYSGMLQTHLPPQVCLAENNTVIMREVPQPISSCIHTQPGRLPASRKTQEGEDVTIQEGEDVTITLTITDPHDETKNVSITLTIPKIVRCHVVGVGGVIGIVSGLISFAVISVLLLSFCVGPRYCRKKRRGSETEAEGEEPNYHYGRYKYHQNSTEFVDTEPTYNCPQSSSEDIHLVDRNEYYED